MRNLAFILLAIWLILTGLLPLVQFNFPQSELVMALLALSAGVLFLFDLRGGGRVSPRLGTLLLGIWLILTGLLPLINITFTGIDMVMALLAIAAGAFILFRRERL